MINLVGDSDSDIYVCSSVIQNLLVSLYTLVLYEKTRIVIFVHIYFIFNSDIKKSRRTIVGASLCFVAREYKFVS